jgi:hypothetical protein
VKVDSLLGSEQEHAKSKHCCALSTAFCRALDEITDRKIGERAAVFFSRIYANRLPAFTTAGSVIHAS